MGKDDLIPPVALTLHCFGQHGQQINELCLKIHFISQAAENKSLFSKTGCTHYSHTDRVL